MKKILALFMAMMLILSSFISFAEGPSSWAEGSINELKEYSLLRPQTFSSYHDEMTRLGFVYLAVVLYEEVNGPITLDPSIRFTDTDDEYVLKAASVGITSGIGEGMFGPNQVLTREQLATFMVRTLELVGITLEKSNEQFSDDHEMSSWAKEAIYKARNHSIISGVGDNTFAPGSNTNVEQSLLVFKRILDQYSTKTYPLQSESKFEGYTLIEVDGGDLSGNREPLVVVDIGYGFREYWAFTNEYGQLVRVIADEIVLQDDENEPVLSTGRYYHDEAKVPGTERTDLDEGHVIADSLGGVANAYNITPQNSTLNRHGDQAYMEDAIRQAGGCTDFEAIITYPDSTTQIPSSYKFTYTINGVTIVDEFGNVDPDEVNEEIDWTINSELVISLVDKAAEEVTISNTGENSINLAGYKLVSVTGNQTFVFSDYVIHPGEDVVVYGKGGTGDIKAWTSYVWNNSSSDPAELYDPNGTLISRY